MGASRPTINAIDGKYRVLAQLGQGGTADVNLAVARGPSGFNKLVVLKSMRPQFRDEPNFKEMFMVEARLAAQLSHPNIVQTNEVFEFEDLPVIVMEYLEGQPLSTVLAKAKTDQDFPLQMHLRAISETLSALEYAHNLSDFEGNELGLVHRDISPHNVFITYDGQIKLLDFGIAKLNTSHVETATGVIKGKLRYMPPEQITGEGVDRRSDVYAAGVMLWEAVTGKKMWAQASEANIMNAVLNGEVPAPSSEKEDVPEELERIIMKALAADQEDRYPSAAAMQADLDEYLASMGSSLRVRDIGQAVTKLFSENREGTRKVVQEQLARVAALKEGDVASFQPIELTSMNTSTGMSSSNTNTVTTQQTSSPRSMLLLALLVSVVTAAVVVFWTQQSGSDRSTEASRVAAEASRQVAEPEEVLLRVTAFPAVAELSLDGEPLPSNPYSRMHPLDDEPHVLTMAAEGYQTQTRKIRLDQDTDIVVTLSELPKAEEPEEVEDGADEPTQKQPRTVYRAPRPRPKAAPKPVAKPDPCDPPYYIDERGVKKFKSECL